MTGVGNVTGELRAALGLLTAWPAPARGARREALAGGLAFFPLVGLGLGAVAAAAAHVTGTLAPPIGGPLGLAVLLGLTGTRPLSGLAAAGEALLRPGAAPEALARLRGRPGIVGMAVGLLALAAKTWAVVTVPAPALALVFAPMLGAWAIVVQCFGGAPTLARGVAAVLVGRARFREFGWASLVALGVALGVADAAGLVVALAAALTTVGLRVYCHRRLGGLTGRCLLATRELVETVVLVVLALLARLIG